MTIKDAALLICEELKNEGLPIQSVGIGNNQIYVYLERKLLKNEKIHNTYEGFAVNVILMGKCYS